MKFNAWRFFAFQSAALAEATVFFMDQRYSCKPLQKWRQYTAGKLRRRQQAVQAAAHFRRRCCMLVSQTIPAFCMTSASVA